eukprot:3612681-Prymnesium_polylepis.1
MYAYGHKAVVVAVPVHTVPRKRKYFNGVLLIGRMATRLDLTGRVESCTGALPAGGHRGGQGSTPPQPKQATACTTQAGTRVQALLFGHLRHSPVRRGSAVANAALAARSRTATGTPGLEPR